MQSRIAWLAAATHVIASFAMLLMLRGGLPGVAEEERLAYMQAHPALWTAGWLTWHLAVISLIAFNVVLALRFRGVASITAVALTTAGAAIDLPTQARYIGILPSLRGEAFAALDRELEVLTGYAANGLYTLAFVLLVVAGWRELPRLALVLAIPVAASGFALSIAALLHDAQLELLTSAVLFPVFTLWIIVVALWLRKDE